MHLLVRYGFEQFKLHFLGLGGWQVGEIPIHEHY